MVSRMFTRLAAAFIMVALTVCSAFAQYGGGSTSTSSGTYSPPKGGYSSGAAIGVGVAAAAGVTIAYLALRNRATLVGCVEESASGLRLMNEKDRTAYALNSSGGSLKAGDRMALKGKKTKSSGGEKSFAVTKVVKDYGACGKNMAADAAP